MKRLLLPVKVFLATLASACVDTPLFAGLVKVQNHPSPPGNDWVFVGYLDAVKCFEEHWMRVTGREGDIIYFEQNLRMPEGELWGLMGYRADCSRNIFTNLSIGGEAMPWIGWEKFRSFTERERVIVCANNN